MSDDLTLVPEYVFDWDDRGSRSTVEIEDAEKFPDAIEVLAQLGREDPDCEVTLVSMGA